MTTGFLDNVIFLAASGGTGDFVEVAAFLAYQTMEAAGAVNSSIYGYKAQSADGSQWEIGIGTYSSTGPTLQRTTVLYNSLGTTAKINFTNPPQVMVTASAENMVFVDEDGNAALAGLILGGDAILTSTFGGVACFAGYPDPTVPTGFVIFNTTDDIASPTNFEGGTVTFDFESDTYFIGTVAGGTGILRDMVLSAQNIWLEPADGGGVFIEYDGGDDLPYYVGIDLSGSSIADGSTSHALRIIFPDGVDSARFMSGQQVGDSIARFVFQLTGGLPGMALGDGTASRDTFVGRGEIAGRVAILDPTGVNGTQIRMYNAYDTFPSPTNEEHCFLGWNSDVFEIGTGASGTGTGRDLQLSAASGLISLPSTNFVVGADSDPHVLFGGTSAFNAVADVDAQAVFVALCYDPTGSGISSASGFGQAKTRATTPAGGVALDDGDEIGVVSYIGDDGVGYNVATFYDICVDGPVSSGVMPTRWQWFNSDQGGSQYLALLIGSDGKVSLGGSAQGPSALHVYDNFDGLPGPTNYSRAIFDLLENDGALTLGTENDGTGRLLDVIALIGSGNLIIRGLGDSVTPASNGDLMVEATSNTSLTFKYKGSDGTVRSGSIALS